MDHDAEPFDAMGNFRPKRRRLRRKTVEGDYEIWYLSARQLSGVVFASVGICSTDTVGELALAFANAAHIRGRLELVYSGNVLTPIQSLKDAGLQNHFTVDAIFRDAFVAIGGLGVVELLSISRDECQRVLQHCPVESDQHGIVCVVCAPGGDVLATSCFRGVVKLWTLSSGDCSVVLDDADGDAALCLQFSPCGSLLALAQESGCVSFWDVRLQSFIHSSWLPEGQMFCPFLRFSPGGNVIAISSLFYEDHYIEVWRLSSRTRLSSLLLDGCVGSFAFSPGGALLAVVGRNNVWSEDFAEIWDLDCYSRQKVLHGLSGPSSVVVFSPCGKLILALSDRGVVLIWSVESGLCVQKFTVSSADRMSHPLSGCALPLLFSPHGNFLLVGSSQGLKVWDTSTWIAEGTLGNSCVHSAVCGVCGV